VRYAAIVLGSCLFIGYADSLLSIAAGVDVPTLGLSGVVMTMMTLLAFLLPKARVRCFLWLLVFVRTIPIPVWLLALGYGAGDVYHVFTDEEGSGVNFLAHVAGAAYGYLVGAIFLQERKVEVRQLAREAGVCA
jgi:membrane associated rhomboid family serine protease